MKSKQSMSMSLEKQRGCFYQPNKIVDVGEKIAGARKDMLKSFSSMLEDVTKERLAANPLSRVVKKLNLVRAVKSGALREIDAIFCDVICMPIRAKKPRVSWIDVALQKSNPEWRTGLDDWVDKTYDALMRLKSFLQLDVKGRDKLFKELMTKRFVNIAEDECRARKIRNADGSKSKIGKRYTPDPTYVRFEILKRFGHKPGLKVDIPLDLIRPDETLTYYNAHGRAIVWPFTPEDDLDVVIDRLVSYMKAHSNKKNAGVRSSAEKGSPKGSLEKGLKYCGVTPTALLSVFSIRKWGIDNPFRVVEINKCFKSLLKEFSSREDAFKWRNGIKDAYFLIWKEAKINRRKIPLVCPCNTRRIGVDRRGGRNVEAEDFMNTFGFRGVQFGNWTHQLERQEFVNQAFDAFLDLAELIGAEPRSLSLNNELGLAFGARGLGRCSAHYEPGEVVINLTKTRGAGSLAHEWWHALDNYFARAAGVKYGFVSEDDHIQVPENVRKMFAKFVQKLAKSDYAVRSRAKGGYWGRMREMAARFFAEWVTNAQSEHRSFNSYLASSVCADKLIEFNYDVYCRQMHIAHLKSVGLDEFKVTKRAYEGYPYPKKEELRECDAELRGVLRLIGSNLN